MDINLLQVQDIVTRALREDIGNGDITTRLTVPDSATGSGVIVAKEAGVIAGLQVAAICFHTVDSRVHFEALVEDGDSVQPGREIVRISGPAASLLAAERVSLNFLQRMSGIATLTSQFVERVRGTKARIVDTRKTTPGLRALEKYAVRAGGGFNHRFGLDDGILIKDNHIAVAGGVAAAVTAAKGCAPHTLRVEVEVQNIVQAREVLEAGADALLLDNMTPSKMAEAVALVAGRAVVEASGGVSLDSVAEIAAAGADIISVGALTHSFKSLDLSLNISLTGGESEGLP